MARVGGIRGTTTFRIHGTKEAKVPKRVGRIIHGGVVPHGRVNQILGREEKDKREKERVILLGKAKGVVRGR